MLPMPGREQRPRPVEVILCERTNLEPAHRATIATRIDTSRATPARQVSPSPETRLQLTQRSDNLVDCVHDLAARLDRAANEEIHAASDYALRSTTFES